MQRLEVSGAVRPIYGSLGAKRLMLKNHEDPQDVTFFFFASLPSAYAQIHLSRTYSRTPQPMFFPKCERPSFTPIQNNMHNSSVLLASTEKKMRQEFEKKKSQEFINVLTLYSL